MAEDLLSARDVALMIARNRSESLPTRVRAARVARDWTTLMEIARSDDAEPGLRLHCVEILTEWQNEGADGFAEVAAQFASALAVHEAVDLEKPDHCKMVIDTSVELVRRLQCALAEEPHTDE